MKIVYESQYDIVYTDDINQITKNIWTEKTETMSWHEFKEEILKLKQIILANNTKHILGNTLGLRFIIKEDFQLWISEHYFPEIVAAGLEKYAIVTSKNLITELTVEQAFEEEKSNAFRTEYFENEADAFSWLIS